MGQGLGPGFTTVATRRSVTFSVEGLEFVLTAFGYASRASPTSKAPPKAIADVFSTSRRPNFMELFSLISISSLG
jgi:hypothetical protein